MAELTAAHRGESAELVKQLNKELYWTGWYAVSSNNIQWTTVTRDILDKRAKKEQIEQEKT